MSRKKRSIAWTIPHDELQNIINESSSMVEILKKVGLNGYNGSGRTLYRRIFENNEFDISLLTLKRTEKRKQHLREMKQSEKKPIEYYLNSHSFSRFHFKQRLIEEKLLDYKCKDCSNLGFHNGKELSLQLEHIDGNTKNNKLDNLCFLCPNCHSQTSTYAGKKNKKPKIYESAEEKENRIISSRKFNPTKDELENLVKNTSMVEIGKIYGVSDNAIRKRCRLLNINW